MGIVMRMIRQIGFVLVLTGAGLHIVLPGAAASEKERLQLASSYLEITLENFDLELLATVALAPVMDRVKAEQPQLYAEKSDRLFRIGEQSLINTMRAVVRAMKVSVAQKFTLEELKLMNQFYGSGIGRRILRKSSSFSTEIGPALIETLARTSSDLQQRFEAEGVQLNTAAVQETGN